MEFSEILEKRSTPGILIFDMDNRLLFANNEALQILPNLKVNKVPHDICELCDRAKESGSNYGILSNTNEEGISLAMRAFMIGRQHVLKEPSHVMVLLEKIIGKRHIDFEEAKKKFEFTKREMEVLRLLCEGYSNKKISDELFIGEYTVKDHIKNIMRKMKVASRSGIIAGLK